MYSDGLLKLPIFTIQKIFKILLTVYSLSPPYYSICQMFAKHNIMNTELYRFNKCTMNQKILLLHKSIIMHYNKYRKNKPQIPMDGR